MDFFKKEGEDDFFKSLKTFYGNYSDITKTNLETIYNSYGSKFDLTLIYNYIVYTLSYNIYEFKSFENFISINKQNIQFVYWWRNKIANMVFLRYKRIQSDSKFYPDFTNIRESNELINFFYTFIPNNIITLDEIKHELYRVFNNYSYIATISNSSNSNNFRPLSKVTILSNQTFNKNYTSSIEAQYIINISDSEYTKSGREISFVSSSKFRRSYFDKNFTLELLYQNE